MPSDVEGTKDDVSSRRSATPWAELLVNSAVPATAVAVNLGEETSEQPSTAKDSSKDKLSVLGSFQRRTFSRISFNGETGPLLSRYRQTRFSSRRVRKRVVFKHGDCNVVQGNVAKRRRRYLQDIFTTLVDAQWRWTLLVFSMNFLLSWLGFAIVWWIIAYAHGDLDPRNFTDANKTFTPCVEDIHGFTSCFLFSVETQHTIGYGSKHTTTECPEAIFIMCIQSMTGVILQAFMVGIVFAKLSRPKKRTQTLLFSRNAVICQRDGQPCLMFRVGDMRKSHIIEAHVRAQMIKRKVTREGELLPFYQTELRVGGDGEEDKIFFIWPTTIVHKIDEHSPLYHLSASDMLKERFEIIVMLEGVIESTGMTTQARSSYLPTEILWGHRFSHIITFKKETGEYEVNYNLFNNTYEVDTPLCSAAELDQLKALHHAKGERMSSATFPTYREDSSSSLTTSSGSSSASSSGGLHMHSPTPPTPIPVMITGPDDSPRRNSINVQPDQRLAVFYTHDEDDDQAGCSSVVIKASEQEDYNTVLEGINASIRKNRGESNKSREERAIPRNESKSTIKKHDSKSSSDGMKRSSTRVSLEPSSSTSAMKKSASRVTLDPSVLSYVDEDKKPERLIRISPPPRLLPRPEVSDIKATNHYPPHSNPEEQV
ncbi:ATP-sensitive inward rectifier potassium channel 12-like isoform X3 [Diachasmimorpha longicaudata]|uniref:ATP-sensitive inward rectifier potassium channel 12-like isoform X3 n=1 Tax=Diachasmimorpha longicaudata TaxID=58733 RepID=UPI0030B86BB3